MIYADSPGRLSGQPSTPLLIVGGGIMGLWAAVHAERQGIDAILLDSGRLGQGASGGLLGALMPHMPDKWSEKKQFQFDALLSLEDEIHRLEDATGLQAGYRRSGRLIPLPKAHLRPIAERHNVDARSHWVAGERRFHWHVLDAALSPDWPAPAFVEAGLVHDTLAARVSPRGLGAVLSAYLKTARHVRVIEGAEVVRIDSSADEALLGDWTAIAFGHCIIAAGHRAFPLLEALGDPLPHRLGQPVKGQAALLKAELDPGLPLLYLDGLYIVPHDGGHVAIGSTSENRFDDPLATDGQLEELIERARLLAPCLAQATIVERWAGLRPKAIDRDPMVGAHPDHANVIALTGGFKVSFGMAHRLAEAAIAAVCGGPLGLPAGFSLENHLVAASRKT
ncbi:FAD-binding oxidoreductase [Agrobacterium sp. a22-2]|uniref:NAD(P)/FAD-dependent oxidoreductase n=1 Tax=Agrobacterium sp. a22-2 TaxID=2283840 RepID=UPI001446B213|nr:FAD-binding oxidoreductase [Agrobacterium sp. a22-2]NKN35774.1 FAD-binding oxidoreductase [Agrobacterium sp. a22-2]